tara:strand:- start:53 stop:205 length:153 start_codon:yes stop_codon:yes gene_type:complete
VSERSESEHESEHESESESEASLEEDSNDLPLRSAFRVFEVWNNFSAALG